MLKNYIKITFRNLVKNRTHTLINIIGLSLGIVCSAIIFLVIQFELSFDTFQKNADNIYRLVHENNQFGTTSYSPGVPNPLPEAMRVDFPDIEELTIVDCNFDPPVISVERRDGTSVKFEEIGGVAFVNPDYTRIFTYTWLMGNPETALENPNSVVISETLAQKYFGSENPIGKQLIYNNSLTFQVTGLVEDVPQNTEMPFNMLLTYDPNEQGSENWKSIASPVQCYLKLPKNVSKQQIESRLNSFYLKHRTDETARFFTHRLQLLREIHLDTRYSSYGPRTVARETLLALGLIGLFLLVTACINFINLNTAVAVQRSKEVGVRKVLGGTRKQLTIQFLAETALITLIAIAISIAAVEILLPQMKIVLGYVLSLHFFTDVWMPIFFLILFVGITVTAGFYPALHLSGFSPIDAIRNKLTSKNIEGLKMRKGLVVLQFGISQVLIISTIVISSQMAYFRSYDMGFDKSAIVEVTLPENDDVKIQRLKHSLQQNPSIKYVTFSNTGTASSNTWGGNYKFIEKEEIKEGHAQVKFVDGDFLDTYQIKLLAGQNLVQADTVNGFLVNQAFVEEVGSGDDYHEIIGKYAEIWGRKAPIVGVVKNFNTISLHKEITPVMIAAQNRYWMAGIKIEMQDLASTLAVIEDSWSAVFPEFVYNYSFLDESIEKFYIGEQTMGYMINTFTGIAVLIGCLGLFGLVSYIASQRTKEIGIRKVLGATFANILSMLSRELAVLIVLAFLISTPFAWFFMRAWLSDFAYQIDLNAGLFGLGLAVSCALALLTIGYKSISAAIANPVDTLKYE